MLRSSSVPSLLLAPCVLSSAALSQSSQQSPPNSCSTPEFDQFNFWVGEWNLSWPGAKPDDLQRGASERFNSPTSNYEEAIHVAL